MIECCGLGWSGSGQVQVESSCQRGNETSGSIKCWELPSGCITCGLSSGAQLHRFRLESISGNSTVIVTSVITSMLGRVHPLKQR
jgi:hypothetical protein